MPERLDRRPQPDLSGSTPDATARPRAFDHASLAAFRVLFGALIVVLVIRYYANGWVFDHHVAPERVFSYPGLGWLPRGEAITHLRFAAMALAGAALALGWRTRWAAATVFVTFTWMHLTDRANYLNHYHLISLLALLAIPAPLGRIWSLDARAGRVAAARTSPRLWLGLLRFQVAAVYVFAGLAKLEPDWLLEGQPLRAWLFERSDLPVIGAVLAHPATATAASRAALVFDLAIPFLVLWPRTRGPAFAALVAFHLATQALFPIGLFPLVMLAAATVLMDPSWPRRVVEVGRAGGRRLARGARFHPGIAGSGDGRTRGPGATGARGRGFAGEVHRASGGSGRGGAWRALAVGFAGVWVAVQIAVPLRGCMEPGSTGWHEIGFRFSWRVMVMEKRGELVYRVRERGASAWREVDPAGFLTPLQARMAATQPDMILDGARWLAADARARGVDLEVRAEARCRLGDRPSRLLIDPDRDLGDPDLDVADVVLPRDPADAGRS